MKKLLLSIIILAGAIVSIAQCNPNDWDFGKVQYAVYPDTVTGLLPGCLGQPYSQVVYFKVPTDAGDVNPAFAGAQISSIRLDSIVYDGAQNITNLGLDLSCSAPNCIFNGGAQYCGNITGVPNQVGEFQVSIVVTVFAFLNLGGFPVPVNFPFAFPGYTYSVSSCGTINTQEYEYAFNLGSVSPNPANQTARIPFELPNTERVELSVVNMVGDQLIRKSFAGKRGENSITLDVADLPSGIYLYTMQSGSYKSTRKLVIQH
jgi:hypothetical protein